MRTLCALIAALCMSVTVHAAEITVAHPSEPLSCIVVSDPPNDINPTWLPLVEVSKYLPMDVEWDSENRAIVITSEDIATKNPWIATQTIPVKHLNVYANELTIVDGVTYCSPWFLARHMPNVAFVHQGRLWYCNVPFDWDGYLYSAMLRLAVVSPNDYAFVVSHLAGGVKVAQEIVLGAKAYFCQNAAGEPTAYIIDTSMYGAELAVAIAHEAWHAHEYMGHAPYSGEVGAWQYHPEVEARLMHELREMKGLL